MEKTLSIQQRDFCLSCNKSTSQCLCSHPILIISHHFYAFYKYLVCLHDLFESTAKPMWCFHIIHLCENTHNCFPSFTKLIHHANDALQAGYCYSAVHTQLVTYHTCSWHAGHRVTKSLCHCVNWYRHQLRFLEVFMAVCRVNKHDHNSLTLIQQADCHKQNFPVRDTLDSL